MLGNLLQARRDPLGFALHLTRRYGDITYYRIGFYTGYLLNHPDYIQHVLQENHRAYNKENYNYEMLKPVLGEGLLTGNGDQWLSHRRMMQPVFHSKRIARFGEVTTTAALQMLQGWDEKVSRGQAIDITSEMMQLTLRVVSKALFSVDISREAGQVGAAFNRLNEDISYRFRTVFVLPLPVPTRRNRAFKKARAELDRVVYEIISRRRAVDESKDDILDMLLAARGEMNIQGMADREIRDELMTLMLAGHETTATLLGWTWYMVAQHPQVYQKLTLEMEETLAGRLPRVEDLEGMPYMEMVLQEVMRLYPPVWIVSRKVLADDEIGGYIIPAGTIVALCPYTMHRHPAFWENPDEFNPQRFLPGRVKNRHRYAYFPFGGGPRYCIGSDFAMMEARLILATILQRYRLDLLPDQLIKPEPLVTLRPLNGIKMNLHSIRPQKIVQTNTTA